MAQPTDPNKFSQNLQHASLEEGMRKMVNPCNRDYGKIFDGWQDVTVQYTIQNVVWWGCVLAFLGMLAALGYIWWQRDTWEKRQECFARAAAVLIGQRNTAYKRARFAIEKHNELADRYDVLGAASDEQKRLDQVRDEIETGRNTANDQSLFGDKSSTKTPAALPEPQPTLIPIGDMSDPTTTGQGERVYVSGGVQYVTLEDHKRRVRALEAKISTLRTASNLMKEKLAAAGL
jgi:hypothetical protein